MLAIGGGVVRVGNEVGGGGDCGVGVGTGVGTGVTAAGISGTGVEISIGVVGGFSGGPFIFWPKYHPAPPTSTRAAIMIAMRIDLRQTDELAVLRSMVSPVELARLRREEGASATRP